MFEFGCEQFLEKDIIYSTFQIKFITTTTKKWSHPWIHFQFNIFTQQQQQHQQKIGRFISIQFGAINTISVTIKTII